MNFYDQLVEATRESREEFLRIPTLQAGVAGKFSLATYLAFLEQAYHHVKHTVPLLMACGARLPDKYEWLRGAVAEYIEEEYGHQEWILNDIQHSGGDAQRVRDDKPGMATELMVAYAYDTINRINPIGFFGMVLVLEGTSVTHATRAAENMQQNLKLPKKAFSYLYSHGSLDLEHVDFFANLMNKVTDEQDQQTIIHCAKQFYLLYGNIFRTLPLTLNEELSHVA